MKTYKLVKGDSIETYENYERVLKEAKWYVRNHPKESAYVICVSSGYAGAQVYVQEISFVEDNAWLIQDKC